MTTVRPVPVGFLIGIVLVAANLRAALTGVGPLLPEIERDTGLSGVWSGLLNTLPLLSFAATSPLVNRVAHRHGSTRVLLLSLLALAAGIVLRSVPGFLYAGMVLASAAIACGNVLLPSVIRGSVPAPRIGAVTALYVTAMSLVAAISSGISVPLADALPGGWRTALGCWALLAAVALAVWLPQRAPVKPVVRTRAPWRSWVAWQVSLFMGLQSLGFYTTIAWLPSILADHGVTAAAAGWQLFLFQVIGLIASTTLTFALRGRADHRWLAALASVLCALAYLVLLVDPGLAIGTSVLLGLGGGTCLVLALTFQSGRAADPAQAVALAGMAQTVGYLVAAAGPLLLGVLHDLAHGWTVPLGLLITLTLAQAAVGFGAGRDIRLHPEVSHIPAGSGVVLDETAHDQQETP